MTDVETVILRFRDLPPINEWETVMFHNVISEKEPGYVWWGWWSKGGEQVPLDEFANLARRARDKDGLLIYLLDSGHGRIYRTVCSDIRWDAVGGVTDSPEPDKTPEYYRTRKVLAWFRLGPIQEHSLKTSDYSYVRVDRFFTAQPSRYTAFYDKRIFSVQELIEQNRTIWFVRKARETDKSHEISLVDAPYISPEHFPKSFTQTGSRSLLWVSDLHYTVPVQKDEKTHHAFPVGQNTPSRKRLGDAIEAALNKYGIKDLAGVLASGDITWKAHPEEFTQSLEFFQWAKKWATLSSYQIAICPLSHPLISCGQARGR